MEPQVATSSAAAQANPQTVCEIPSVYQPDPFFGMMHLPRFLAKVRLQLRHELPARHYRNFAEGLDALLCLHIGMEPAEMIELAEECDSDELFYQRLAIIFPGNMDVPAWNRQLCQLGLHGAYKTQLESIKAQLGIDERDDIATFADLAEWQDGRIG